MVVWALAILAAAAHALQRNISLWWVIPAMSPMLQLEPHDAWIDTYGSFDDNSYQPGVIGSGVSTVSSAGPGRRVSLGYPGYNATFYGSLQRGDETTPIALEVDGVAQQAPRIESRTDGFHSVRGYSNYDIPLGSHNASIGLGDGAPGDTRLYIEWAEVHVPVVGRGYVLRCALC